MRVAAHAVALSVVALVIAPAAALGAADVFIQPPTSPEGAGDTPASIVAGDWNGDSYGDLAVANGDSDNITILLGDGLGDFTPAPSSPEAVGDGPSSIVAAQLSGDANTDLAVTNGADDNVSILLGEGSGDFKRSAHSPEGVGSNPSSVLASHFNTDGVLDLAVANGGDDNVSILLSAAGGDFTPAETSPEAVGDAPTSLTIVKPQLAPYTSLFVANGGDDNVSRLSGFHGLADFTANSPPIPVGDRPTQVAVAIFAVEYPLNFGLAVANEGSDNVSILHYGSTPVPTSPVGVGDGPTSITTFHRYSDQFISDLAVANGDSDNVSILLNAPPAPALPPASPPAQAAPTGNPVQLKQCIKKARKKYKDKPAKKKKAIKKCRKKFG